MLVSLRIQWTVVAACSFVCIALGEPQPDTLALGAALSFLGMVVRAAGVAVEGEAGECEWGGAYARVRHPRLLGAFLAGAGAVVAASSTGAFGHWVPRTVAPVGLLYYFTEALPRADSEQRDRLRSLQLARAELYLDGVGSLVPRLRRFVHSPRAVVRWKNLLAPGEIARAAAWAAFFAFLYYQMIAPAPFRFQI